MPTFGKIEEHLSAAVDDPIMQFRKNDFGACQCLWIVLKQINLTAFDIELQNANIFDVFDQF